MVVEVRGVSRSVKTLLAGVAVVLAALAVTVEPARACSCVPPDPWSYLRQADGAFVGRLVSRREADQGRAVLTFRVERAVKGKIGKTVEVVTANNGAACGIETSVGQRIGLFLSREGGGWQGHLCWQVAPEDLLAAVALPAPNGRGPVKLLVGGRFGPARTMALDAKGRTLAYGLGRGKVREFSACPGGRRVAELVALDTPDPPHTSYIVAICELPTLRLIREQRLRHRYFDTSGLRCVDVNADQVIAFWGSGPDLERRARLIRITPTEVTTIWQGMAWYASFRENFAYIQLFARAGTTLIAVDLRTGATRKLGTVRVHGVYDLIADPARTRFAGLAYDEARACCPRLVVADLAQRPVSVRTLRLPNAVGQLFWLSHGRLALFQNTEDAAVIFDRTLRVVSRFRWPGISSTVVGSTVYGVGRGSLVKAELPSGPARVVRRLPGVTETIVSAKR